MHYMEVEKQSTDLERLKTQSESTFFLKRLTNSTNGPSISVSFSSPPRVSSQASEETSDSHLPLSYPVFNRDDKYYTPSFVLISDKDKLTESLQSHLKKHQMKKDEMDIEKEELFVPKPSKCSSYCSICKTIYEDYLTHVNIPKHQQLMRMSEFCSDIQKCCAIFNFDQSAEQQCEKSKCEKKKKIKKEKPAKKSTAKISQYLSSTTLQSNCVFQNKVK